MIQKRTLIGILLAATLLGLIPVLSLAKPTTSQNAQEGVELLKNPSFEGLNCRAGSDPGWCLDNWSPSANFDGSVHGNIMTPQGWISWWRKSDGYGQPEVKTIPNVPPFSGSLPRIRSGNYGLLLFTFYRNQDTGVYQVVSGLQPNATIQLSAYGQGWSCDNDSSQGLSCGDQWNHTFQVGIAPDGNVDPFSPNIVWSTAQLAPDSFHRIGPVTAQVGEAGTVCVFLRSKSKWPFKHLDAYWDDASLVMTTPGETPTNTPLPAPPTATYGPSPTPRSTPTPRPDGATVHIVESGDTLFGISLMYDIPIEQIRTLNATALGVNEIIVPGQALVIAVPSEPVAPTPLPPPPTAEPQVGATLAAEVAVAEPSGGGASICVLAFNDLNSNTFRDDESAEGLMPQVEFTIVGDAGEVGRYTSDGLTEPHCFPGLTAGAYRVTLSAAPDGFTASGQPERAVAVADGTSLDVQFGIVRGEGSIAAPGEAADPEAEGEQGSGASGGSTASRIFATLAKIVGVLVLAVAVGAAVLFVLNQRRVA